MSTKALMLAGTLVLAGTALTGAAQAGGLSMCDVDSDFNLRIADNGLEFHRASGSPARVELRGGRLLVDGQVQALSAADAKRVAAFEAGLRALVPEVKLIALDAIDIAYTAVVQVAHALAGEDSAPAERLMASLDRIRLEATAQIEASTDTAGFDDAAFERRIEAMVEELVPAITADAAAIAIGIALSGDETAMQDFERRMERMGEDIERQVERQARALESRAHALCPRVAELDALDNALEYRLANNRPLDLIRTD